MATRWYIVPVLVLFLVGCVAGQVANITVYWDPNTEKDLAGYRVFIVDTNKVTLPKPVDRDSAYVYFRPKDLELVPGMIWRNLPKDLTQWTWTNVCCVDSTVLIAVAAYDTAGNVSQATSLFYRVKGVDTEPPAPPTRVQVINVIIINNSEGRR